MLDEVLDSLAPQSADVIVDGTFGAGGYSSAILAAGAKVIGIDRDPDAIAAGAELVSQANGQLTLLEGRFSRLDHLVENAGFSQVDGIVLDVGVSSMQLDQHHRGFSFRHDGPLDMRMEQSGPTAADLVNLVERANLTRIIGILGEERKASRVSRAIIERRAKMKFSTTADLANVVAQAVGKGKNDRIHPATRTFQALRIFLNSELEELASALLAAERLLKPGGRIVVVSFHSLEDRVVKRFFANRSGGDGGSRYLPQSEKLSPSFLLVKRGAVKPGQMEVDRNPRARSAKLRAARRTDAVALHDGFKIFGLADFSGVTEISRKGEQ